MSWRGWIRLEWALARRRACGSSALVWRWMGYIACAKGRRVSHGLAKVEEQEVEVRSKQVDVRLRLDPPDSDQTAGTV